MIDAKSMQENLIISKMTVHGWTGVRVDNRVGKEIETTYEANEAGSYHKMLVNKDALKPVREREGNIRKYFTNNTFYLPSMSERAVPVKKYFEFMQEMKNLEAGYLEAAKELCESFQYEKENAKSRLGKMYNENEYPDEESLMKKFRVDIQFYPMPNSNTDYILMEPQALEVFKNQVEENIKVAGEEGERSLFSKLQSELQELRKACQRTEIKKFYSTVFGGNLRETIKSIEGLNIFGNESLKQFCNEASELCNGDFRDEYYRKTISNKIFRLENRISLFLENN